MNWKRLLLIALVAGGFALVPVQRSDAQVWVGIGPIEIGGAIMAILGTIPMAITDHTRTIIIGLHTIGMAGIGTITATTIIITTIGTNAP